ncbi:hypothetical protein [Bacillus mycoides]|uniref:hypothetical protein n=1 Tax=Bacillus mycoides TaxID=1405 RepID=UPI003D215B4C
MFYGVSVRQIQTNQAWFPETVKTYAINKTVQEFSFWDLANVPQGSKKHKGMCNGSIVDCYVYVTDTLFAIFKPNPNAKQFYVPLPFEEHMAYIRDKKKFVI